jgi:hypothetical protein
MAKKRIGMADIEIDAGVVTLPGSSLQGASGTSRGRPRKEGEPTENFQVRIPSDIATEIRVEAAKRRQSQASLILQAWEMWKKNPPENY